ncbi:MAG: exodeoxyribonuclease VII small subunit [Coriobacteriia bacterium]|nr:exodeoxyribonuclease VII small subunit [Coriobacteriia bacterium]
MPEESHGFAAARVRLEEIVTQVRKKDTSLEKSLDLLEEGVRLAGSCTELIDRADWSAEASIASDGEAVGSEQGAEEPHDTSAEESS